MSVWTTSQELRRSRWRYSSCASEAVVEVPSSSLGGYSLYLRNRLRRLKAPLRGLHLLGDYSINLGDYSINLRNHPTRLAEILTIVDTMLDSPTLFPGTSVSCTCSPPRPCSRAVFALVFGKKRRRKRKGTQSALQDRYTLASRPLLTCK